MAPKKTIVKSERRSAGTIFVKNKNPERRKKIGFGNFRFPVALNWTEMKMKLKIGDGRFFFFKSWSTNGTGSRAQSSNLFSKSILTCTVLERLLGY